jgi:hypothetical protein
MKACDPMTATAEELQKAFPDLGLFSAEDIVAWRIDHDAFPPETTLVGDLGLDRDLANRLVEFATAWVTAKDVINDKANKASASSSSSSSSSSAASEPGEDAKLAEAKAAGYLFDDEDDGGGRPPGPSISFTDHPASGPGTATLIGVAPPPPASTPSRSPKREATEAPEVIDVTHTAKSIRADDFDRAAAALDEIFHDRDRSLPPPIPATTAPDTTPTAASSSPSTEKEDSSAAPATEPSAEVPAHPTPPPPVKLIANDWAEEDTRNEEKPVDVFEIMPKEDGPAERESGSTSRASDRPTIASAVDEGQEQEQEHEHEQTGASAKPKRARRLVPALLAVVLAANVGLGVGLFQTRRDEQKALAPIAPMSAEVKAIHSGQATLEKELDKTKAVLAETKARVDKQEKAIATTTHAVEKVAEDQKSAEQTSARETAAINQRLANVERNRKETTYSLSEVVKIIDAVQEPSTRGAPSHASPTSSSPPSSTAALAAAAPPSPAAAAPHASPAGHTSPAGGHDAHAQPPAAAHH